MLDINVSYQVHFFSNYTDINATTENTLKLMNLFREYGFLPSTVNELSPLQSPVPILRPRLSSPNGEWSIVILSSNVVIERNYNGEEEGIDKFIEMSSKMLGNFMSEYTNKGKRMSLVTKSLFSEMSQEKLDNIYKRMSNPIHFYNDKPPFEWNLRSVRRINYTAAENSEEINFITNIGRIQGKLNQNGNPKDFDRISLDFDINTIAEKEEARFTHQAISDFLNNAVQTRSEVINELELLIDDNRN